MLYVRLPNDMLIHVVLVMLSSLSSSGWCNRTSDSVGLLYVKVTTLRIYAVTS